MKDSNTNVVMWSVLGTSAYGLANYEFDKDHVYETHYIQMAVYKKLKDVYPKIKLKIFLTEGAKRDNWERRLEKGEEVDDGLKKRLDDEKAEYEAVSITDGSNEAEIWENFNIFYDEIGENDRIFVDITHSFRSIPVILLSVLGLAKHTKNIAVEQIYYGTYSFGNYENNINETVISLGIYNQITDWSNSISRFLETGNAKIMFEMTQEQFGLIARENHAIFRNDNVEGSFLKSIRKLNNNLNTFSENLFSVRGREIVNNAKTINSILSELSSYNTEGQIKALSPFYKIIDRVKTLFENVKEDKNDIENTNEIIGLCIKFSLLQQGITFLEENITSYLLSHTNDSNLGNRFTINLLFNAAFTTANKADREGKFYDNGKFKNPNKVYKKEDLYFINFQNAFQEGLNDKERLQNLKLELYNDSAFIYKIGQLKRNIQNIRNDINHAGFREGPTDIRKMTKLIKEFLEGFKNIITYEKGLEKDKLTISTGKLKKTMK